MVRDKACRTHVGAEVSREEKTSSLGSRHENVSKGNVACHTGPEAAGSVPESPKVPT